MAIISGIFFSPLFASWSRLPPAVPAAGPIISFLTLVLFVCPSDGKRMRVVFQKHIVHLAFVCRSTGIATMLHLLF